MLNKSMIINNVAPVVYSERNTQQYNIGHEPSNSFYYYKDQANSEYCRNFDIYYLKCLYPEQLLNIDLVKLITADILHSIKEKQVMLAIDSTSEAYYDMIDSCYLLLKKYDIPSSQLLLIADSPNLKAYMDKRSITYNLEPFNLEWYHYSQRLMKGTMFGEFYLEPGDVLPNLKSPLLQESFEKKFITLNRRMRPHRCLLLTLLSKRNLLNEGYCSFDNIDNESYQYNMVNYNISDTSVLDNLPLYLDFDLSIHNPCYKGQRKLFQYHRKSYFSVVTETYSDNDFDPVFLSEKTFRAIAHKHPFLTISTHGSLKMLKDLGYKTFDGIIDESYDEIVDEYSRIVAIVDEIERLCRLSPSELQEFKTRALEIVEYNFIKLMTKTNYNVKI